VALVQGHGTYDRWQIVRKWVVVLCSKCSFLYTALFLLWYHTQFHSHTGSTPLTALASIARC